MKPVKIVILALILLLIVSNAYYFYLQRNRCELVLNIKPDMETGYFQNSLCNGKVLQANNSLSIIDSKCVIDEKENAVIQTWYPETALVDDYFIKFNLVCPKYKNGVMGKI